jgi:predicted GH43/DUF377 family glycosyl hydrolase
MIKLTRHSDNPIFIANPDNAWEHDGAFNGCVVEKDGVYHMVYRALSSQQQHQGVDMRVSTVGYATSTDGVKFTNERQLITPTEDWEKYGCEDPRITYLDGKFYIFYTALSVYPFAAYGIKTAVAITKDFQTFEKHPVSTFNAKAMALFPEKINGKMAALITLNTDMPPAKIGVAIFEHEEDIWSPHFWEDWYEHANEHTIHLLRSMTDQIELGSPPLKTKAGWIFMYSYIGNYMTNDKDFGIEVALLDHDNPRKLIARTDHSLLNPEMSYELEGDVPNVIFPSGALIKDDDLYAYYGAADQRVAIATCKIDELLHELTTHTPNSLNISSPFRLTRYPGNPILKPILELEWQAQAVFNPAAVYEDGKVHIAYRAQSFNGTSYVGYASSKDGIHIDENLDYPIYEPREVFEQKDHNIGNSGCEDPRLTKIGDRFYIVYTAYDGKNPPRVAMSSISIKDFLNKEWHWDRPRLVSPAGVDDKDACIVAGKKEGTYLAFHRLSDAIWLQVTNNLDFSEENPMQGSILAQAREDKWDNVKLGIAGPPIEVDEGWLLLYHAVSNPGSAYKIGAMLLDYDDPMKILGRTDEPIFEPEMEYEKVGIIPNVVFPCGSVIIGDTLYVYYGGADTVVGVATMPVKNLINILLNR